MKKQFKEIDLAKLEQEQLETSKNIENTMRQIAADIEKRKKMQL